MAETIGTGRYRHKAWGIYQSAQEAMALPGATGAQHGDFFCHGRNKWVTGWIALSDEWED